MKRGVLGPIKQGHVRESSTESSPSPALAEKGLPEHQAQVNWFKPCRRMGPARTNGLIKQDSWLGHEASLVFKIRQCKGSGG